MPAFEKQAASLAEETLHRLAYRLNVIWKKWGTEDYPTDHGIHFRNKMFLFGDWMLDMFKQGCARNSEVPNDWLFKNAKTFLQLSAEDFLRCIGMARIHMQAFWVNQLIEQNPRVFRDNATMKHELIGFGRQLDWIYTVHDLRVDIAQSWHQLLVDHIGNGEEYVQASKEHWGSHLVRTALGYSEASAPEMWDHWACAAEMSSLNQLDKDPTSTQRFCDSVFAQF